MAEKTHCEICDRNFKDAAGLSMHNAAKHSENIKKERAPINYKKIRNWGIFILIVAGIIALIYFPISNAKTLPPTDPRGHIEKIPASHIMKEPVEDAIQRHMLEHVDGIGRPGIFINYNCEKFDCEPGLIENLEGFANKYNYVYVAPFPKMSVKIALTKAGKIQTLDEFDNREIEKFITGRLPPEESVDVPVPEESADSQSQEEQIDDSLTTTDIELNTVEISSSGFSPSSLTINAGDTVEFVATDSSNRWPASNVHPSHTAYPESSINKCGSSPNTIFDACRGVAEGGSFSFTFSEKGAWRYHDHLNPGIGGVIIVN